MRNPFIYKASTDRVEWLFNNAFSEIVKKQWPSIVEDKDYFRAIPLKLEDMPTCGFLFPPGSLFMVCPNDTDTIHVFDQDMNKLASYVMES